MNSTATRGERAATAEKVQPDALQDDVRGNAEVNMDVILDVPVTMAMEVGRTRISIRNLLQLNQGSVVELERAAGEPLDAKPQRRGAGRGSRSHRLAG